MARICEVCGRIEEPEDEENKYDMLDVCMECTEQVLHPTAKLYDD